MKKSMVPLILSASLGVQLGCDRSQFRLTQDTQERATSKIPLPSPQHQAPPPLRTQEPEPEPTPVVPPPHTEAQRLSLDELDQIHSTFAKSLKNSAAHSEALQTVWNQQTMASEKFSAKIQGTLDQLSIQVIYDGEVITEKQGLSLNPSGRLVRTAAAQDYTMAALCGDSKCTLIFAVFRKVENGKVVINIPLYFKQIKGVYDQVDLRNDAEYEVELKNRKKPTASNLKI